jgi:hypothetical protein
LRPFGIFVDTTYRTTNTRREFLGRSNWVNGNPTGTLGPTTVNYNIPLAAGAFGTWQATDTLITWAPGVELFNTTPFYGGNLAPPATGATTLSGVTDDLNNYQGLIDTSQDTLWVTHLGSTTTPSGLPYVSVVSAVSTFTPAPFNPTPGLPTTLNGTLVAQTRNNTLQIDYRRSQFHALLDPAQPAGATPGGDQIFIEAQALNGTHGDQILGGAPGLAFMNLDTGTYDVDTGPMLFANPYSSTYVVAAGIAANTTYTYTLPGIPGSVTGTASIVQVRHLTDFLEPGGLVTPHLAPVSNMKVNGLDIHGANQSGFGTPVTLSWTWSPAHGGDPSPTYYRIQIYPLGQDANGNLITGGSFSGLPYDVLLTASTSVTIPPNTNLFVAGAAYFVSVAAVYEPGRDAIANPDSNHQPYAYSAQALSMWFKP